MFNGRYCVLSVQMWLDATGTPIEMRHGGDDSKTRMDDEAIATVFGGKWPEGLKHGNKFTLNVDGSLSLTDAPELVVALAGDSKRAEFYRKKCAAMKDFVSKARENNEMRRSLFDKGTKECLAEWFADQEILEWADRTERRSCRVELTS